MTFGLVADVYDFYPESVRLYAMLLTLVSQINMVVIFVPRSNDIRRCFLKNTVDKMLGKKSLIC